MIVAIFTQSLYHIVARGYYAKQNTRTPLIISIVAFIVQVIAAIGLSWLGFGPEGLAHAVSISALFEVAVLLWFENRDMNRKLLTKDFWYAMLKMTFASVVTGLVSYAMTKLLPLRSTDNSFLETFPKFCIITLVSALVYVFTCLVLRVEEVKPVIAKIKQVLFKNL
jgi:putative peptidoglycan lipid II flippase